MINSLLSPNLRDYHLQMPIGVIHTLQARHRRCETSTGGAVVVEVELLLVAVVGVVVVGLVVIVDTCE